MQIAIEVNLTAKPKQATADDFKLSIRRKMAKFDFDGAQEKYLKI